MLGPFPGFVWCFARLFIQAPAGRQRFNVLEALDAVTHELITIANDAYINAESVWALLRKLAESGLAHPITLVLENAHYQWCAVVQALALELGIELLFLSPYSPNLNLIERLEIKQVRRPDESPYLLGHYLGHDLGSTWPMVSRSGRPER